MLHLNCALTILLAVAIDRSHGVLADKGKFDAVKPSTLESLPDERRAINFKDRVEEQTSNKRQLSENETDKSPDARQEKKIRTLAGPLIAEGGDKFNNHHCCDSRYDVGSPGRPESSQGGSGGGFKGSSDNGRYPSRYGSRPEDRFGWQSYNPASSGRRGSAGASASAGSSSSGLGGSGGGLYGSHSGGDRYGGSRPSYYGGDSEYDRPSNSGNRPGRPSYGSYGGNGYGDSGAYGSSGYEVSRPGGYGGGRPPGGINFGGGRPGGGSYGGGSYGGGGHGVYGSIGEEDEFPGHDEGGDGGPPHPGVNNLQTQKAVALKALAGVALIGAAAALATNPVLLPIGVLAGRKKRSAYSSSQIETIDVDELMKLLEDHVPKIYREKIRKEVLGSPTCVARLACEVQHEYITEQKETSDNGNTDNVYNSLRRRLVNLIQSKVLHSDVHYKDIRKLIRSVEAYEGNCNVFVCDFIKD